jgi:flagellar basal-body rod protein FlgC
MELLKTIKISAAGMRAQGVRIKTIAENIANAESLSPTPGQDPYRRKVVTFKNELDRKLGVELVKVRDIEYDKSDFKKRFDPTHPAADKDGYVKMPNVSPLVEMMDMREAQRSYRANLRIIEVAKSMLSRTIDLLRN